MNGEKNECQNVESINLSCAYGIVNSSVRKEKTNTRFVAVQKFFFNTDFVESSIYNNYCLTIPYV